MNKKDISELKLDLGICADCLISIFLGIFIHNILGIIWFAISIAVNIYNYMKENR